MVPVKESIETWQWPYPETTTSEPATPPPPDSPGPTNETDPEKTPSEAGA